MAQKSGYLNRTLEFHKIYEEEIIPILKSYKQQKEKADEKNRYDYLGAALCFLSLITFMLACSGSVERFYSMILVIVSVLLCLLGSSIMEPMRAELQNNELKKKLFFKKKCMSKLLRVFGNIKWYNNCEVIKTVEICETGLFPPILYRITDDEFVGEYQGVKFRMSETKFPVNRFIGFTGIILAFEANKSFESHTIIVSKLAPDRHHSFKLEPVTLEDPKFCRDYNVYSSDQTEARYLITPSFMERFRKLKVAFKTTDIACAFLKNKVIFALDSEGLSGLSKNLFEIDAYSAFTDDREAINIFYNELTSVLDMAAYFKLDEKTGL
ncbi:TPA: DUF3137 domain-containing protein [Candidatus Gastranaerophilales bacterium HUM_3]|jgi:hypothetical protein|nr:MAG: hypothetical protein BHW62_07065 [Acinetobacter sp. CAG:196_36_41]CCZ50980.1 putative uncharacterized protein [Acinetobacter sp. CAG:196]DAA85532.1 MAG TPA: DUF3137 domain-containing protein [Candidatus Gastranaerophilales bacterium HUM_3]DAA95486.1 MAG TPA: DUF3137 domain-containing protein [Candidatus Gastranaerophilales bacterium HUM_8]DAB00655.1 MAG TPA: DUF3137 domain-containing protein [Candidatus Gastranaerophilales bacterium HUM_11]DAB17200.1 MAG TPA: DUF3137 domain-containing 